MKLEKIRDSFLSDIKATIQFELTKAIKTIHIDSEERTSYIINEQKVINQQIKTIDIKIKHMQSQLEELDTSKKKIVLYGLLE